MTTHHRRAEALREGLGLAAVVAAAIAVYLAVRQQPAGADELKIQIGTLRSTVAELALVDQQAGDALPPRFVRAHTGQLAQTVDDARDELAQMKPKPELREVHAQSLGEARRVRDETAALQRSGHALSDSARAELQAQAQRLKGHEDGLRR